MKRLIKRLLVATLIVANVGTLVGCGSKQDKKPNIDKPIATAEKKKASGTIAASADTPLVIGETSLTGKFSPFFAKTGADQTATALTQLNLFKTDRSGSLVYHGIEGETKEYKDKEYTYFGPADMEVSKWKGETTYHITLGKNVKFSDGVRMTIDDVIFSMYVYCDKKYDGSVSFSKLPIAGLKAYQKGKIKVKVKAHKKTKTKIKKVTAISGIRKISDYEMSVRVKGYQKSDVYKFMIPVAPLHYYGNKAKYNYAAEKFGFKKGDLRGIQKKTKQPIGAGPYKFVKYEGGIVYYEANDQYIMGEPKTTYIQLKKVKEAEVVSGLAEGSIDAYDSNGNNNLLNKVVETNLSGELSGKTIDTKQINAESYTYIGINAGKVQVGGNAGSTASKNLRKALATAFACYRNQAVTDKYGLSAGVVQYPVSQDAWTSVQDTESDYEEAYSKDTSGDGIYDEDMDATQREDAMKPIVIQYLKAAGYKIADDKVVSAPQGASTSFKVTMLKGADAVMENVVKDAASTLQKMGITIQVKWIKSAKKLQKILASGKQQIWCGKQTTQGDDLKGQFTSGNIAGGTKQNVFHLSDTKLDKLIDTAVKSDMTEDARDIYLDCYKQILDWAVIVPVYQKKQASLFSYERVKISSLASYETQYHNWLSQIEKVKMN